MVSPPPPPTLQSGTRGFSDVVDQVLRFVQQPSSNLKNLKSGSAKDLDTNFNRHTGPVSLNVNCSPKSSLDAERGNEHEASPLSPSRTLIASGSSNSSSSTPRSKYRSLKRTNSAGSTSSSASRSTETQNRSAQGRKGEITGKEEKGKRLNMSDRLRRLGRKMQSQKSSLSSPKISVGELADDSERDPRIRPKSGVYTPAISSTLGSRTGERTMGKTPEKGKGKEKQLRAPRAHAKLLSMVVEADEPSADIPSSSSSGFSKSGATTPTVVQTPGATPRTQSYGLSTPNNDDQPRDDPPEPMTLAARIQALIAGLPFPSLPGAGANTGNNARPSEPPPTSRGSPQFHYSPEVSSWSSPLPVSPSPLPTSSLPPLPHDYGVDLSVEMDTDGRPIPPPYASPLAPRERMILEEFLSSPVIMNGELPQEDAVRPARKAGGAPSRGSANNTSPAQGKEKPKATAKVTRSIWSVLESMGTSMGRAQVSSASLSPSATSASLDVPTSPLAPQQSGTLADANAHENESMFSDTGSSVMIYSPLIPSGAQDLPELAETVPMVSEHPTFGVDENRAGHPPSTATPTALGTPPSDPGFVETASSWIPSTVRQWSLVQAISVWSTTTPASSGANADGGTGTTAASSTSISTATRATEATTTTTDLGSNEPQSGPTPTSPPVRKAWVPSTTKMSVQAMWWGYRLYLPPPVMAILSDRTLEASKRAALITSALTWFFTNLPITALPPPLQPVALLLQRIAPFLGYIGAFISWSWGVIEGYDVGYGVTLTATWLLPVALIPGTWHKDEFPMSPLALGQPVPLPQILYSPAPTSDRALEPMRMIQTPAGPFPARVTEFLPLPTPAVMNTPLASPSTSNSAPVAAAPSLPSSPASLHSDTSPLPVAAGQSTPLTTLTPMPPTPVSPSHTPRPYREIELALSTPQSIEMNIATSMSSPTPTPSSHYQTPLLSSPAPTASSRYQTPLSSPQIPLSPRLTSPAHSTPLIYRAMPIPQPIPSSPSVPISPSGMQTVASTHSPSSPNLPPSHSSPTYTPRSQPHSKSKSTSTHVSACVPVAPTPVDVSPVPPATVQASVGSPNPQRKSKATGSSQSQRHQEIRSSSHSPHAPSEEPQTMPIETRTTTRRPTSRTQTPTTARASRSHIYPDATPVPASVPVGSPLEQHLLSGPLMSPVPLPDVDLPVSASTLSPPATFPSMVASTSVPAPMYAYADKEERDRERNRDRARIRERARAIFRRTTPSPAAGAQKARAK